MEVSSKKASHVLQRTNLDDPFTTACTQTQFTKLFLPEPDHVSGTQSTRDQSSAIAGRGTKRANLLFLAGEIKGIVRGSGTLANVTREAGGENLSFLVGEYS